MASLVPSLTSTLRVPPTLLDLKRRTLPALLKEAAKRAYEAREANAAIPRIQEIAFVVDKQYKPRVYSVRTARQLWLLKSHSVPGTPAVLVSKRALKRGSMGTWSVTTEAEIEVPQPGGGVFNLTADPNVPVYVEVGKGRLKEALARTRKALAAKKKAGDLVDDVKKEIERLQAETKSFDAAVKKALGASCPDGTQMAGAPPPWGTSVGCVRADGARLTRHGPWFVWTEVELYEDERVTTQEWGSFAGGKKHGLWTVIDGATGHVGHTAFVNGDGVDTAFMFEPFDDRECSSTRKRKQFMAKVAATAEKLPSGMGWDAIVVDVVERDLLGRSPCTEVVIALAKSMVDHDDRASVRRGANRLLVDHVKAVAKVDKSAAWKIVNAESFPAELKAKVGDVEPENLKRKRRVRELLQERKGVRHSGRYADRLLMLHCKLRKEEYEGSAKTWKLSQQCDGPKNYRRCSYKQRQAVKAKIQRIDTARRNKRAKRDKEIRAVGEEMLYQATRAGDQGEAIRAGAWVMKMANAKCPMKDPTQ